MLNKTRSLESPIFVQGYKDKMSKILAHDELTARHHFVRTLIGFASIFGFRLFSTEITHAYLQSAEILGETSF